MEQYKKVLIIRYGEIALKKKNRYFFESKLMQNLKNRLKDMDVVLSKEHGRFFVHYNEIDENELIIRVRKIFGIVSISPAISVENDIEAIKNEAVALVKKDVENKSKVRFKVESRRVDKSFKFKSPEISRIVGGFLDDEIEQLVVDVKTPEILVNIEVRSKTYIYHKVIQGYSGMPYGTLGKGMLLLSGGIDSPVAGWMIAKRGLKIEAVHFHSFPFTSDRAQEKVYDLAKIITDYTGEIIVHSVNLLEIQRAIQEKCPSSQMTILSRRFMMMIAERIAKENSCYAIITGESMGQVASQTLEGLTVTNDSVTLPVFRPLIAMDKVDIVKVAKQIGTYDTSILPFEDCCTVFLPEKVVTRPRLEDILASEALLDKENLIKNAINQKNTHKFDLS